MKFLDRKMVADKLGLSIDTVRRMENEARWAHLNFPKSFVVGRKKRMWLESDVEAWMQSQATQRISAS